MNHSPIAINHRDSLTGWMVMFIITIAVLLIMLGPNFFYPPVYAQAKSTHIWPQPLNTDQPPVFSCRIVRSYPHDPNAFTQGLIFSEGHFFESTGLKGFSSIREVDPLTGKVERITPLPHRFFGEGLTRFKDRLIQLTWKEGVIFSYDIRSFEIMETFTWPRQGWGLTFDGDHLIISDGSSHLFFLDPHTFTISRTLAVKAPKGPVNRLNELEWVEGMVLANVWQTDNIAVISPKSGRVAAWISMAGLGATPRRGVPNGIAYDPMNQRLYLTGKRWPHIFEVVLTQ